jgi:hypothetical protein
MSKNIASILVCGVLGSVFSFNAQALPLSPAPNQEAGSMVTLVAGGCGIGFHRGPYGGCLRNGVYAPVVVAPYAAPVVVAPYGAPVVVVPHGCPYGYHYGAYGRCYPY